MPRQRRFLLSAVSNWLAFAATLAVAFFLAPYLIRKLGDGPYGIWIFVESILACFTLFDLGIAAGVVRYAAKYHAENLQHDLNRLVSTSLALFLGLGTIALLTGLAIHPFLGPVFSRSGLSAVEFQVFTLLMLSNLAISLPMSVFPSLLDGLERFGIKSAARIFFLSARTIAIIAVMESQPGIISLAVVFTITTVAEHLVMAALCRIVLPGLRIGRRLVDREMIRRVRGYSLNAFLAMIAGRVTTQAGAIIIGVCLSAPEITWFAIALRLVEFAKALPRSATITLTPAISSLEARGDLAAIRSIFLKATRWALCLILPVQIGLFIFGKPFLVIWLGNAEYGSRCFPAMAVLAATLSLVIAQSVAARILYGMGQLRWFARAALGEALLNVLLCLLLVRPLGIIGIAWAAVIPNFCFCCCVIVFACRRLELRLGDYLSAAWCRPLAAGLIPLGIWLLDWDPAGWGSLATAIAAGLLPYALVVLVRERRSERSRRGFTPGELPVSRPVPVGRVPG